MKILKILNIILALIICTGGTLAQSKRQMKEQNESLKQEADFLNKLIDEQEEQKQLEEAKSERGEKVESTRIEKLFFDNKFNHPEKLQAIDEASANSYEVAYKKAVDRANYRLYMSYFNFNRVASIIYQKSKQVNGDKDNKDILDALFTEGLGDFNLLPYNSPKVVDHVKINNDSTGEYTVQVLVEYQTPDESNLETSQIDSLDRALFRKQMERVYDEYEIVKSGHVKKDSIISTYEATPEEVREINERLYKMLMHSSEMKKRLISFENETKELTKKQLSEYNEALWWKIDDLRHRYLLSDQLEQYKNQLEQYERGGRLIEQTRLEKLEFEKPNENIGKLKELGEASEDDLFLAFSKAEAKAKSYIYNRIMDFARVAYAIHAKLMQKNGKKANRELLDGFFSSYIKNVMNGSKVVDFEKMYNKYNEKYTVQVLVDYDIPVDTKSNEFKALSEVIRYLVSW